MGKKNKLKKKHLKKKCSFGTFEKKEEEEEEKKKSGTDNQ